MPRLVAPTPALQRSFLAAMAEFAQEGRTGDDSAIGQDLARQAPRWQDAEVFAAYVEALRADEREETPRAEGWVPCTTWWWVEDEEYLGRIALRHRLTDRLLELGGHIGYDVRRSRRREGHATAMLDAVLPLARERGIEQALLTCDATNLASRRVIEAAGGRLEDQRGEKLRFWVPTRAATADGWAARGGGRTGERSSP